MEIEELVAEHALWVLDQPRARMRAGSMYVTQRPRARSARRAGHAQHGHVAGFDGAALALVELVVRGHERNGTRPGIAQRSFGAEDRTVRDAEDAEARAVDLRARCEVVVRRGDVSA